MYDALMVLTGTISVVVLAIAIISLLFRTDKPSTSETIVTMFIAISISTIILFACNATSTNRSEMNEILSKSSIGWHTVYKNDINASVKIYQDSIAGQRVLDPEKKVTSKEIDQFFSKISDTSEVRVVATNAIDSTRKAATISKKNVIEKWPKGMKPDRADGRITKIEYRSTVAHLKWFGMNVEDREIAEIRLTVEYSGTNVTSTKDLFDN